MKLNRSFLNKKVLKYVLILSLIAVIVYYFTTTTEGFQSSTTCTLPNGSSGIYYTQSNRYYLWTCKNYGVVCPSGFESGSLNTEDPVKSKLNRCVKNIQMCDDNSDYNEKTNSCKDSYTGQSTPLRSGAVCSKGAGEEKYVSGSWCQIAKTAKPTCGPRLQYPGDNVLMTFNDNLQKCVYCSSGDTYGKGKHPPVPFACYPN